MFPRIKFFCVSISHIVQYINFPILLFYGFSIAICFSMCNSCLEPFLSYSFSLCHSAIWRLGDPWISFQWCRAVPSHLGPPRVRRPITCTKEECQGSGIKEESHLILCHPVPVKESKLQLDVSKSIV